MCRNQMNIILFKENIVIEFCLLHFRNQSSNGF